MPLLHETIDTTLPPDEAFAFIADFANCPAWDPNTPTSERLGSFVDPTTFVPWHAQPAACGGLYWPDAITVDRTGMVYVVDAGSDRLMGPRL